MYLLKDVDTDKEVMQVTVPRQYEAQAVGLNPDFALISNRGGLMMSIAKESDVLQKTNTSAVKKEFRAIAGSTGSVYVGITNESTPEVYSISKLNGDSQSTFLSIERIPL